jgi:hypothetical protein
MIKSMTIEFQHAANQRFAVHRLATEYRDAGISIVPIRLDGSKEPALDRWKPYQSRIANDEELLEWFSHGCHGVGLVCGLISGGLEVLDFDDCRLYEPWRQQVKSIVERLPVVETGGGGWHVLFRCNEIGGNIKIASDPQRREKKTLIETRGEGGLIVAEANPCAVHKSGLPYVQYSGPYLPQIPLITPEERCELWRAARKFDLRGAAFTRKLSEKYTRTTVAHCGSVHPVITAFNNRTDWESILHPAGWTCCDGIHWTRPGKLQGTSAKVVTADDGSELLTVFSGNAGPLSPDGSHRTLSKFKAWALLSFHGDNRAAFKAARQEVTA